MSVFSSRDVIICFVPHVHSTEVWQCVYQTGKYCHKHSKLNIHTLSCYEMESALLCGIKITMTHFVENAIDYNYNTSSQQDTLFQKKLGLSGGFCANSTNLCPRAVIPPCLYSALCTALRTASHTHPGCICCPNRKDTLSQYRLRVLPNVKYRLPMSAGLNL